MSSSIPAAAGASLAPKKRVPSCMMPTKASTRKSEQKPTSAVVPTTKAKVVPTTKKPDISLKDQQVSETRQRPSVVRKPALKTAKGKEVSKREVSYKGNAGRLFMDDGYEEILVRILEKVDKWDLGSCLRICKNTNNTIVETSSLQLRLRQLLYNVDPDERSDDIATRNSAEVVKNLINQQTRIADLNYRPDRKTYLPPNTAEGKEVHFMGGQLLAFWYSDPRHWSIRMSTSDFLPILGNLSPNEYAAFNADSGVIVQYDQRMSDENGAEAVLVLRFLDAFHHTVGQPHHPHPLAQKARLDIVLPYTLQGPAQKLELRFHPSGVVGVLLRSNSGHSELVVLDWHAGICLGVVMITGDDYRIADFLLLSRSQFIYLGLSTVQGRTRSSISRYICSPIHQKAAETATGSRFHFNDQVPFQHDTCLYLSDVDADLSDKASIFMQSVRDDDRIRDRVISVAITTRWHTSQGAILLSQLDALAGSGGCTSNVSYTLPKMRSARPMPKTTQQHCVPWGNGAMVFERRPAGHHASQAHGTRLAHIGRYRKNSTPMLIIRDYDPRMILAPATHLFTRLGELRDSDRERLTELPSHRRTCGYKAQAFPLPRVSDDIALLRLFWAGDLAVVLQSSNDYGLDVLQFFKSNW